MSIYNQEFVERLASERNVHAERHLCSDCVHRIDCERGTYDTTIDPHPCEFAYSEGWEAVDNGMGYWVVKCCHFKKLDMRQFHKAYLQTEQWKHISQRAKSAANFKCEMCGSGINLCVHHTTYENLMRERRHMDDLVVLCKNCHEKVHEEDIKTKGKYQAKKQPLKPYEPSDDFKKYLEFVTLKTGTCKDVILKFMELQRKYICSPYKFELALLDEYRENGFTPSYEWEHETYFRSLKEVP